MHDSTLRVRGKRPLSPLTKVFFSRLFPLPFLVVGLFCLYGGFKEFIAARQSTDWPTAPGVISTSEVERKQSTSRKSKSITFRAHVVYAYEVGGKTMSSQRVAYGDYGSSDPSHAQEIISRFPANSQVTVYYHPHDPAQSVLEPGVAAQTFFQPAFGLVFASAGAGMLLFLPRLMRQDESV